MAVELPPLQMTVEEKLHALGASGNDLCRNEEKIPVPQWHKDLLDERERLVSEGRAHSLKTGKPPKHGLRTKSVKIEILDLAKFDLLDGFHFYEKQQSGLVPIF